MSNVIVHTEKEFEEALREELEDDVEGEVLAELGITNSSAQPRPNSPKYPPGINLAGSPTACLTIIIMHHGIVCVLRMPARTTHKRKYMCICMHNVNRWLLIR